MLLIPFRRQFQPLFHPDAGRIAELVSGALDGVDAAVGHEVDAAPGERRHFTFEGREQRERGRDKICQPGWNAPGDQRSMQGLGDEGGECAESDCRGAGDIVAMADGLRWLRAEQERADQVVDVDRLQ